MSIVGTIQGTDAILSVYRDSWEPFVCSTTVSMQIQATKAGVRTRGDGHWKKYTYQDVQFTISLSGLLKFDDENMTGWDWINSQLGFVNLLVRISFDDENGNVRTVQGYVLVETSGINYAPGTLVKNDFQLQGSGKLDIFDGLIPCPAVITAITIDGQEAADGTITVNYTFTGDAAMVKYRIDDTGDYVYALAGATLTVPGLSVAQHSIEIIPVCSNDYEGTGLSQVFQVTQALICTSATTGATITAQAGLINTPSSGLTIVTGTGAPSITFAMSGPATRFYYFLDFGSTFTYANAGDSISLAGLTAGMHSISCVPVCDFGGGKWVIGTGATYSFNVAANLSQSTINYSYSNFPPGNSLSIYVNGVQTIALNNANGSGSITVAVGATVRASLSSGQASGTRFVSLTVTDNTTSTVLYNDGVPSPGTETFSFTANGDEFTINGLVSA